MSDEVIALIVGLLSGAVGYLLVTFWFQPILRFRDVRSQIASDLIFFANVINADGLNDAMKERLQQRVEADRRHSADLAAICNELPPLYRKYLRMRGIEPDRAFPDLMGLSNTRDWDAASKRVERIRRFLGIPPPDS